MTMQYLDFTIFRRHQEIKFGGRRGAAASATGLIAAVALAVTIGLPSPAEAAASDHAPQTDSGLSMTVAKAHLQLLSVAATAAEPNVTRDSYGVTTPPPPPPPAPAASVQNARSVSLGSPTASKKLSVVAPAPSAGGASIVAFASQFVGVVPYVVGGNSPATGFTCDTFVRYVYAAVGISIHGNADVEASQGTVISRSDAVAGDLVWYPNQHIGIYDGSGGIIDAPKPGMNVSHRKIWGSPLFVRI